jgi:hypothetical protein
MTARRDRRPSDEHGVLLKFELLGIDGTGFRPIIYFRSETIT